MLLSREKVIFTSNITSFFLNETYIDMMKTEEFFQTERQVIINERSSENGDYLSDNRPLNFHNNFQNYEETPGV